MRFRVFNYKIDNIIIIFICLLFLMLQDEEEETPLAAFETEGTKADLAVLMSTYKVHRTLMVLHVNNLILDDNSHLVRNVDMLHVENIKKLLLKNPYNFSAPFVLIVDLEQCPTVKEWDYNKRLEWNYRVIGGNHGARAKAELFKTYGKQIFGEVEAWVYAGLNKKQIQTLGWQHNIDQEYRKNMTNIDVVRACHNLFVEYGEKRSVELRIACCQECSLDYIPGKRDSMAKHDPTFQVAWRQGEIWELQDTIFSMWQKYEILGQNKPKEPKKSEKKGSLRPQ